MSVSLDMFDTNPSLWRIDDKEWMTKRKQEWRLIQPRLKLCQSIDSRVIPHYKKYFFKGGGYDSFYASPKGDVFTSDSAHVTDIMLQFWLHPSPDISTMTIPTNMYVDPRKWQSDIKQFFGNIERSKLDLSEYGCLGGRERQLLLFFNPGLDYREEHDFGHGQVYPACFQPYNIGHLFVRALDMEMSATEYKNSMVAFLPGLALLDHFDYAVDTFPGAVYDYNYSDPKKKEKFTDRDRKQWQEVSDELETETKHVLGHLLIFEKSKVFSTVAESRPDTAEFVVAFMERYRKRDFRDGFLNLLDEISKGL